MCKLCTLSMRLKQISKKNSSLSDAGKLSGLIKHKLKTQTETAKVKFF